MTETKKPKKTKAKAKEENVVIDKEHHSDVDDIKTGPNTSTGATSTTMPILHNKSVSTPGTRGMDETVSVSVSPAPLDSINVVANKEPTTVSVAGEMVKKSKKKKAEKED